MGMLNPSSRRDTRSFARRARGPVIAALIASGFFVALANASEPNLLAANASFDVGGRLQVAYSLAYSDDAGATCAATPSTPVTVTIGASAPLHAEPSTLIFDSCDTHLNVVFTADAAGSHDVMAEIASGPVDGLQVSPGLLYLGVFDAPVRPPLSQGSSEDTTAPQWRCTPPGADATWHNDNLTLACTAWDEESGLSLFTPAHFTLATSMAETEETSDADTGTETLCDGAGNCVLAGNMRGFNIDIRGPERIRVDGAIREGDSFVWGTVPRDNHTCTAADFGSGMGECTVEGYTTDIGSHVLFAVATDRMGNWSYKNLFYDVTPWTMAFGDGFDDDRHDQVATGATVLIPFQVFAGSTVGEREQIDPAVVKSISRREVSCGLEIPVSGAIPIDRDGLSRDGAQGRFELSWTAPASPSCHDISFDLIDGDRRTVRITVE